MPMRNIALKVTTLSNKYMKRSIILLAICLFPFMSKAHVATDSISLPNNPIEKFVYLQKQSATNTEAMYMLANCYYEGDGCEQNLQKSFECLANAAEKGHLQAMHDLAYCYAKGEGVVKDTGKAECWYKRCIDLGSIRSYSGLTTLYIDMGRYSLAFHSAEEGASKDDAMSYLNLGFFYDNGYYCEKDQAKACKYFSNAAELGLPKAQLELGQHYMMGRGVEVDYDKAFSLFESSCKYEPNSCYHLSRCYYYGLGCNKDLDKALYWALVSVDYGIDNAIYDVSLIYYDLEKYDEAYEWVSIIAEPGRENKNCQELTRAQYLLGWLYFYGKGTQMDREKARIIFNIIIETGNDLEIMGKVKTMLENK